MKAFVKTLTLALGIILISIGFIGWSMDYYSMSVMTTIIMMLLATVSVIFGVYLVIKTIWSPRQPLLSREFGSLADLSEEEVEIYATLGNLTMMIYNDDTLLLKDKYDKIDKLMANADAELAIEEAKAHYNYKNCRG